MSQLILNMIHLFISLVALLVNIYLAGERAIGTIFLFLNERILCKAWRFFKKVFFFLLESLWCVLKTLFSYVYDVALFHKLTALFMVVAEIFFFFFFRILVVLVILVSALLLCLWILLLPLFLLFFIPSEKIGTFMIENPVFSLGHLKELGLVSETKQAAFFYVPSDSMTGDGIPLWREHAVLCFMGCALYVFGVFAFLVSYRIITKDSMQEAVTFFYQDVFPMYMDFIHTNYIGRYMHFIHNCLFIAIDRKFLIPSYRPDLGIYYKGDMVYYFVLNTDDPFVLQFVPIFCVWCFLVATIMSIPFGFGYVFYFLSLRFLYKLNILLVRHFFYPLFSIVAIKEDLGVMIQRLKGSVNYFNAFRSCFGELYVLTAIICYGLIVWLTLH
jgi:hypothetical protein